MESAQYHYSLKLDLKLKILNKDPNAVLPDHCFSNKGSNPISQTGQDNHHSALSQNGKEEEKENVGK